jgi:hypothetical protein
MNGKQVRIWKKTVVGNVKIDPGIRLEEKEIITKKL